MTVTYIEMYTVPSKKLIDLYLEIYIIGIIEKLHSNINYMAPYQCTLLARSIA